MDSDLKKALQRDKNLVKHTTHQLADTDRDGVINAVDCEPRNPDKQGLVHDVLKKIKAKHEELKQKHEQNKTMKDTVQGRILQGDIKSEKDVDKHYTTSSPMYMYAKKLIRQKLLNEARSEAVFKAQKKMIVAKVTQNITKRPRQRPPINPLLPQPMRQQKPRVAYAPAFNPMGDDLALDPSMPQFKAKQAKLQQDVRRKIQKKKPKPRGKTIIIKV